MMYDYAKLVRLSRFIAMIGTLGLHTDDLAMTENLVSLVKSL